MIQIGKMRKKILRTIKSKRYFRVLIRYMFNLKINNGLIWELLINIENKRQLKKNLRLEERFLEIGPGDCRIEKFETLNIEWNNNVDYVFDAEKKLPFSKNSFDLVYASHVLEHLPWYKTEEILKEWIRILKPNGKLIIFVPDGLKVMNTIMEAELNNLSELPDNWQVLNPDRNIYLWANGHLFYGAKTQYPSWHKAFFTYKYLAFLLNKLELKEIKRTEDSDILGVNHGWINLGIKGTK